VRRLLLVRHAPTAATRSFAFPVDEPLDEQGRAAAAAFGAAITVEASARRGQPEYPPAERETLSSPSLRCRQTAEAARLERPCLVGALAECDFGAWAGRTLEQVWAEDPRGAEAWMTDPRASPHGGESLLAFAARVGEWLDRRATLDGHATPERKATPECSAIAITHGGVVKAAVVHALGAPIDAFWRIEASPLAVTELQRHDGGWTVARVNCTIRPPARGSSVS
jgi:broad specificity phosphatase PhoE